LKTRTCADPSPIHWPLLLPSIVGPWWLTKNYHLKNRNLSPPAKEIRSHSEREGPRSVHSWWFLHSDVCSSLYSLIIIPFGRRDECKIRLMEFALCCSFINRTPAAKHPARRVSFLFIPCLILNPFPYFLY
jgi:hypothetical protein